jgi:hypothetical protein
MKLPILELHERLSNNNFTAGRQHAIHIRAIHAVTPDAEDGKAIVLMSNGGVLLAEESYEEVLGRWKEMESRKHEQS